MQLQSSGLGLGSWVNSICDRAGYSGSALSTSNYLLRLVLSAAVCRLQMLQQQLTDSSKRQGACIALHSGQSQQPQHICACLCSSALQQVRRRDIFFGSGDCQEGCPNQRAPCLERMHVHLKVQHSFLLRCRPGEFRNLFLHFAASWLHSCRLEYLAKQRPGQ